MTLRQGDNYTIASFSVKDQYYNYFKNKEDNPGQFYRCEVTGKQATIAHERIQRGDMVSVSAEGVWRLYDGKKIFDLKNSRITFLEKTQNRETKASEDLF